jgi:hypothetical protein
MPEKQREEMIQSILRRTSGSPCRRAEALLCDHIDGTLEELDARLVQGHLDHCSGCRELTATLVEMQPTLTEMAEIEPAEDFVEGVLAATLPWPARLRRRFRMLGEEWVRLLRRPRIAWEGAYVGTMLLLLVFGTPLSPFSNVPSQALDLAQENPVRSLAENRMAGAPEAISQWSAAIRNSTGNRAVNFLAAARDEVVDRLGRAAEASRALPPHTADLGEALWQADGGGSAAALGSIGGDVRSIWSAMTTSRIPAGGTDEVEPKEIDQSQKTDNQNRELEDSRGEPL